MVNVQDLEKIGKELRSNGQAERLKTLAASADGQKLRQMADRSALAEAARKGDTAAMRDMMSRLLATAEGQRLSAELQKLLREKSHG